MTPSLKGKPHAAQSQLSTSSAHHSELAKSWLSLCISEHELCNRIEVDPFVPARFVDVGSEDGTDPIRVHVIAIEDLGTLYCALSHCWGGATNVLAVDSSNLERLQHRIDPSVLVKTFLDAVTVVRRLGVNYLWIDCLCIL